MRLPNAERAVIAKPKITDYLLSFTHPYGRSKAKFFAQLGFSAANWRELEAALKRLAADCDVTTTSATPYGTKYIVDGRLNAPRNASAMIRAVWFIESGEDVPQFVTAYPL